MVRRYLGTEALIGQEVPWYSGSNWSCRRFLGTEALIGQEAFFYLLKKRRTKKNCQARRYLGAEALIRQEVPWCRGSH